MKKFILFTLVALAAGTAQSQMVVQAHKVTLQPQIGRDAHGYDACGIRAVVLAERADGFDGYDFSINVYNGAMEGMMKAGKTTVSTAEILKGHAVPQAVKPGPVNFWIAQEAQSKPLSPLKIRKAENPAYILATGDLKLSLQAIMAIAKGEKMQFAVRYKTQRLDTVVAFAGALKDEEMKPLMACFDGLIARMEETLELDSFSTVVKPAKGR